MVIQLHTQLIIKNYPAIFSYFSSYLLMDFLILFWGKSWTCDLLQHFPCICSGCMVSTTINSSKNHHNLHQVLIFRWFNIFLPICFNMNRFSWQLLVVWFHSSYATMCYLSRPGWCNYHVKCSWGSSRISILCKEKLKKRTSDSRFDMVERNYLQEKTFMLNWVGRNRL
jgi:hypothetical protein